MAICVVVHTAGIVIMAQALLNRSDVLEERSRPAAHMVMLIGVFAVIIFLHLIEAGIWAFFYYLRGLFLDYETSLYFSLICYTTIGFGDVVLPQKWRLLGSIEGISGVLLCGLSTAFLFAIVNRMVQMRIQALVGNKATGSDHPTRR